MKVIVRQDDGMEDDITEAVRILWDIADKSMDHGSGFLSSEEEAILDVTGCLLRTKDAVWDKTLDSPYGGKGAHRAPTDEDVQSARAKLTHLRSAGTDD